MNPKQFINTMRQRHGEHLRLCEGATTDQINCFEEFTGISLPDELAMLYQEANGELMDSPFGLFLGLQFMDLYGAYNAWKSFEDLRQDVSVFEDLNNWAIEIANPEGKVLPGYSNQAWIPFAKDYGGNFLAIDMAPGPNGNVGQVINMGKDEDYHFVLAPSLLGLLGWIGDQIEAGHTTVTNGTFEYSGPEASGHFLDEARKIFSQKVN